MALPKTALGKEVMRETARVFRQNRDKINRMYIAGQATCVYAAHKLAKALERKFRKSIGVTIIGGEYSGVGHYWVEVSVPGERILLDIGNNALARSLETGRIIPIIKKVKKVVVVPGTQITKPKRPKGYGRVDERYHSARDFRREMTRPGR